MATIVLVHGIAQEQLTPDTMEQDWIPAIAGGLRLAGRPDLADRLWRHARPGDLEVRLAFYGDLFLAEDQQGEADEPLPLPAQHLADALLTEWVERVAARSTDPRDRQNGQRARAILESPEDRQGLRAGLRPVLTALTRTRPLATLSEGIARSFLNKALHQVSCYLTDNTLRNQVQARVATHLGRDTRVLIGHSLGSVVAYEAAHRHPHPLPALITLGSPLGMRTIVYERTRPQPPTVPPQVERWINVADRDDLVAASLDLTAQFPGPAGVLENTYTVDNGARPHDATFYLAKKTVANAIAEALSDPQGRR